MKRWSRLDWFIILVFAALVILFYWPILTPNPADRQSFPPGDFYLQFWAFTTFDVRELSAGRLPLWNPYSFAGSPFWADVQAAVFYPPSLLTLLLSAPWGFSAFALEIEAIAHFWLAAVFMYLFMRRITASRPAGVIAALTFTFSGYLTGYPSQQLAVLEADVWLPLILFFLHRASQQMATAERRQPTEEQLSIINSQWSIVNSLRSAPPLLCSLAPLLLAGLAWGMTLLAGHPQSAFIVACTSLAYFLYLRFTTSYPLGIYDLRTSAKPRSGTPLISRLTPHALRFTFYVLRFVLPALLFLLTGLALAAIQFIPAVEYTLRSVRAEGTYDKMSGGFPLVDLIQFLLPGQISHYSPLYVGVVGLILALWVIFANPNRHVIFWAIVAFAALLISFGGNTFLYTPFYLSIPGFSIFRGQERWAFAVAFSLAVLAGYGFKTLLAAAKTSTLQSEASPEDASRIRAQPPLGTHHVPHVPHSLSRLTFSLFLLSLLLTFLFFFGLNQTGWTPNSPFYGLLGAASLLAILLALAWLLWRFGPRLHPALFTAFAAALICFDLFSVNWQTNLYPQPPEWHTQMPAVVAAIKQDAAAAPNEPFRVYNEFRLYDNYGIPFELEDLWGASPLRPMRYDRLLAPPMPIERAWELLNVKYVITWRQELYVPSTIIYEEPAEKDTTYVHRLNTVGPRAWLVTQAETADDQTILQKITDPNFDRWHIALLEPGAERYIQLIEAGRRGSEEMADVLRTTHHVSRITSHASRFTLHVAANSPTLLILSEVDYPGWQATVDGQSAPILRAYYTLRAVPVPAGEHTVELTFRPFSFTIGAIVTILSIVVIGIALFLTWRK
ncbi:MAG: YfhO family protein [Anaerolineales bacterium]|nr:YfhO family protein [Anaerolineales bacterium]